jgi:hypothetical protein
VVIIKVGKATVDLGWEHRKGHGHGGNCHRVLRR